MAHDAAAERKRRVLKNSMTATMRRIELLVDRETEALRSRSEIDLKDSNNRKSQALLELGLAARAFEGSALDEDIAAELRALRGKLERNQAMLQLHLDAVREVATIVADTIRDRDWDGTYSEHLGSVGGQR